MTEKKGTSLLINKEDSSDEEIEDGQYETEEEDVSVSSEEHEPDNQEKNGTAQDDSEDSDDGPYEEDNMFSDDNYEGFAFVQDITCNMNDKARIPDTWILLDSQSTVDVFKNKKLLKNICDTKSPCHCLGLSKNSSPSFLVTSTTDPFPRWLSSQKIHPTSLLGLSEMWCC